jgi:uridine phosphorylase
MEVGDFVITQDVDRAESTSDKIMPRKWLFGKRYEAITDEIMMAKLLCNAQRNKETFQQAYVGKTRVTNEAYFDALRSKYILTGIPQKGIPEFSARKLKKLQKKYAQILGVSMEFSVYCALRDKYNANFGKNIKVGNLLTVSDLVVERKNSIGIEELEARQPKVEEAQIITGLETLVSMSK